MAKPPKEKWYERKPVPIDLIMRLVKSLGTHATTIRVVEELRKEGFHVEEDIVSTMTHARRVGALVLMPDGWWRVEE